MSNTDIAYRERVGANLTKRLADAIEDGSVTRGEAAQIARYILDNIDKTHTSADVFQFLSTLSEKWPMFQDFFESEEGTRKQVEDAYASEKVTDLIRQNKIEEALRMAEESSKKSSE